MPPLLDRDQPSPAEFLAQVRAAGGQVTSDLASFVAPHLVPSESWGKRDLHGPYRKEVARLLISSASKADRSLVVHLLEQETEAAEAHGATSEARRLFSYLLCRIGEVEDTLAIWRAKNSSFDGFGSVDVQFTVGAGVEETLSYLDGQDSELASYAASYIRECITTGDFDDLGGHMAAHDQEAAWF